MTENLGELGLAVKRLQSRHHREASGRLAALEVSLPQWDMLRQLQQAPDASLHQLAEATFQTDQAAGALAARMVTKGLLTRVDGPGRAVRHAITAAGQQIAADGAAVMDQTLEETLGRLSVPEREQLHRLLLHALGE